MDRRLVQIARATSRVAQGIEEESVVTDAVYVSDPAHPCLQVLPVGRLRMQGPAPALLNENAAHRNWRSNRRRRTLGGWYSAFSTMVVSIRSWLSSSAASAAAASNAATSPIVPSERRNIIAHCVAEVIEEVLELFPSLRRLSRSLAFSLSGGEQQMLAIGRALMSRPRLLMLDEPSLGLAPKLVDQVFAKLVEVNHRGTAVLLVEQNARMALAVAHRAYVLGSGRVVAHGPAAEMAADERVKNAYLGIAA
jgi:ABC-type molybdenum transport system ATPase subunit/photorepair protein PhrA